MLWSSGTVVSYVRTGQIKIHHQSMYLLRTERVGGNKSERNLRFVKPFLMFSSLPFVLQSLAHLRRGEDARGEAGKGSGQKGSLDKMSALHSPVVGEPFRALIAVTERNLG